MSSLQEMGAHKGMDKPSLGETGVPFAGVLVPGMGSRMKVNVPRLGWAGLGCSTSTAGDLVSIIGQGM